jgi:hypothetical protein
LSPRAGLSFSFHRNRGVSYSPDPLDYATSGFAGISATGWSEMTNFDHIVLDRANFSTDYLKQWRVIRLLLCVRSPLSRTLECHFAQVSRTTIRQWTVISRSVGAFLPKRGSLI